MQWDQANDPIALKWNANGNKISTSVLMVTKIVILIVILITYDDDYDNDYTFVTAKTTINYTNPKTGDVRNQFYCLKFWSLIYLSGSYSIRMHIMFKQISFAKITYIIQMQFF